MGSKLVRVVISLWDYIKTESKISEIKGEKKMLEKVKEIVADSLGADVETLTEATSFKEDLGADSSTTSYSRRRRWWSMWVTTGWTTSNGV